MSIWKTLFSFRGRINRVDFWISVLWVVALWCATALARFIPSATMRGLSAAILLIGGLVVWFSAVTRRLHDRDKSAWYLFLFFALPSALQMAFKPHKAGYTTLYLFSGGTGSFIDLLCLVISIWMIVEVGFLPGIAGPNRYGSDTSATSEASVARADTLTRSGQGG